MAEKLENASTGCLNWRIEEIGEDKAVFVVANSPDSPSGKVVIAHCNSQYTDNKANARLIAAAPNLLKALNDSRDAPAQRCLQVRIHRHRVLRGTSPPGR